jgi:hypothetical protein
VVWTEFVWLRIGIRAFVNAVMNHQVPQLVTSQIVLSYIVIYTTISWLCSVTHFQDSLDIEIVTESTFCSSPYIGPTTIVCSR